MAQSWDPGSGDRKFVRTLEFELRPDFRLSPRRLAQRSAVKMGSSSSEARDEDRISDNIGSNVDVVVVDLADADGAALAHKRKCARGEFP